MSGRQYLYHIAMSTNCRSGRIQMTTPPSCWCGCWQRLGSPYVVDCGMERVKRNIQHFSLQRLILISPCETRGYCNVNHQGLMTHNSSSFLSSNYSRINCDSDTNTTTSGWKVCIYICESEVKTADQLINGSNKKLLLGLLFYNCKIVSQSNSETRCLHK